MACHLGLALEDVALAGHIYREALEEEDRHVASALDSKRKETS